MEAQPTPGVLREGAISPRPGRWYRSREQALGIRLMAMIFVPGWVAGTVIVIERIPSPLATLLVIVVPGWILAWLVVRAGWMGIQVKDHGVRVRNHLRTRDIPWAEIERFSVGTAGMFPAVGLVHLTDGSTVPIFGIQPRNVFFFPNDHSALDLVAQLEQVRAARGSAEPRATSSAVP